MKIRAIATLLIFLITSNILLAKNSNNSNKSNKISKSKQTATIFEDYDLNKINLNSDEIAKEIEKSLLFDQESYQRMNFYKKPNFRKTEFEIISGEKKEKLSENKNATNEEKSKKAVAEVIIYEPKEDESLLREQEKLAYNASLIGQYEVAIELYKKILQKEPKNNQVKFALAVAYQNIKQFRQAKTIYYQLLKENLENNQEIISNLLSILIEENPHDAVYIISRLTVQNPKSAQIIAQAGIAFEKLNDYQNSINFLKKAIAIDGEKIDYQYNLAIIYDKSNDYENAINLYSQVINNLKNDNNDNFSIEQIKKRIELLKEDYQNKKDDLN